MHLVLHGRAQVVAQAGARLAGVHGRGAGFAKRQGIAGREHGCGLARGAVGEVGGRVFLEILHTHRALELVGQAAIALGPFHREPKGHELLGTEIAPMARREVTQVALVGQPGEAQPGGEVGVGGAVHMPVHAAAQLGARIAAHPRTGDAVQGAVAVQAQLAVVPGHINAATRGRHTAPAVAGAGVLRAGKRQQAVGHRAARQVHRHGQLVIDGHAVAHTARDIRLAKTQRGAADVGLEPTGFVAHAHADATVAL